MDVEGMASAHAYAKNGAVAWKNKQMVKRARDTKSLQVLELVQGDEHTFDVCLRMQGSRSHGLWCLHRLSQPLLLLWWRWTDGNA